MPDFAGQIKNIGDCFDKGDIGGGIQKILSFGLPEMGGGSSQSAGAGAGAGAGSIGGGMPTAEDLMGIIGFAGQDQVQAGYASSATSSGASLPTTNPTWQQSWSNAVNAVEKNYDSLDTAFGLGGKDGVIGRCDLEAALKNPAISEELRAACRFLLENEAAFNELSAASGSGECDGFIRKDDIAAAKQALPADVATTEPSDGTTGTTGTTGTGSTGTDLSGIDFSGMSIEQIVRTIMMQTMGSLDGKIEEVAKKLKEAQARLNGAKDGTSEAAEAKTSVTDLQMQLQDLVGRRKAMFDLCSNMMNAEHSMAMTTVGNIGRI